ncbi:MAG: NAD(+)/NADH kinase [Tissierellia bacterium]|nr:NAD(+)/NADH kinase [Tissierellia bacterium]
MSERIINIISNSNFESRKTTKDLIKKLRQAGFSPTTKLSNQAELTITVGGDGAFIKAVNRSKFSEIPIVGVNTGTLGFFQEISPQALDEFIEAYKKGDYTLDPLSLIGAEIFTKKRRYFVHAVNEVVVKAKNSKVIHLNVFIDHSHVEKFSGDGMMVSTAAGSTGYSLSLGGALIYPKLEVLCLTPMAPILNQAYRSLNNSIIVPGQLIISLVPEKRYTNSTLLVVDGNEYAYSQLQRINLRLASKKINKLVVSDQSYWENLKSKFLI